MKVRSGITVVTIVRNAPEDLERTIASVLAQTLAPLRHVVVDGASTDRTVEIARAYQELHPEDVRFLSEPDRGIADALNKGVRLADDSPIVCMNAGDEFGSSSSLETFERALRDAPEGSIVYGDSELLYDGYTTIQPCDHALLDSRRVFWNPLCHQAMAVPRRWMLEHPFDATLRYSMDLDLWLELLDRGVPFRKVEEVACRYRMGGVSSNPRNIPRIVAEHLRVYRAHGRGYKALPALSVSIRHRLEILGGGAARAILKRIRTRRAR